MPTSLDIDHCPTASAPAGTIPDDLEGTLLRNGPGLFEIGGIPVSQPFDGDGMVICSSCDTILPAMHVIPQVDLEARSQMHLNSCSLVNDRIDLMNSMKGLRVPQPTDFHSSSDPPACYCR